MEGDDEWEDHLIVSYTPPQGCEMTMTEFERLKANTKLEIFRIHNDMTPEELEAIPAECSKTVAVCREAARRMKDESKYLYFLGPSSTPGEYWAGVGMKVYKVSSRRYEKPPAVYESVGFMRFILEWNKYIVIAASSTQPVVADLDLKKTRNLKQAFAGYAQKSIISTPDGFLYYLAEPSKVLKVAPDLTEVEVAVNVSHFEWDDNRRRLTILKSNGILEVEGGAIQVDLNSWISPDKSVTNETAVFLLLPSAKNEYEAGDSLQASFQSFRVLRGSETLLVFLHQCQLCLVCSQTMKPIHLSAPSEHTVHSFVQMGLCKPVRGVEMVLCSAKYHKVLLAAVFRNKVYQLAIQDSSEDPWAFSWIYDRPVVFGRGHISFVKISFKR